MDHKHSTELANDANSKNDEPTVAQRLFEDWKNSVVKIKTDNGSGTGFFVDDHTIATNYHVIRGSRTFKAIDVNSNAYTLGTEVYADPVHDLAILTIQGPKPNNVKPIPVAGGDRDLTGVRLYHLGHPLGRELELIQGVGKGNCDERKFFTTTQGQVSHQRRAVLQKQIDDPRNASLLAERLTVIEAPGVTHGSSGAPFVDRDGNAVAIVRKGVRNEDGTIYCAPSQHLRNLIDRSRLPLNPDTPESEFFARTGAYENGFENYFGKLKYNPKGFLTDSVPLGIAGLGAGLTQTNMSDKLLRTTGVRMNVGLTVSGAALIPLALRDIRGYNTATDDLTEKKYGLALAADAVTGAGFTTKTVANLMQPKASTLRMGRAGLVLGGIGLGGRLATELIPNYYGVDIPYFNELRGH